LSGLYNIDILPYRETYMRKHEFLNYSAALKIVSKARKRLMISKYKETAAQMYSS
jgi:hypothetical protein